jgi:hypothetical protein
MSAEFHGPILGIFFHREIERRFKLVRAGNRDRGFAPVYIDPAFKKPRRRVDAPIESGDTIVSFAHDASEHGVDEACIAANGTVAIREFHGKIHRRVILHLEKQNLRSPQKKQDFDARRVLRHSALQ